MTTSPIPRLRSPLRINDASATIYPGAYELCDGIDQDCDGTTSDETDRPYYLDSDGDGFGAAALMTVSCDMPQGYSSNADDCNDSNPAICPEAPETCNQKDDNCNGLVDEDLGSPYYSDDDGDGYGNDNAAVFACDTPEGFSALNTDCDDEDPDIHPDALERCNGADDNCNNQIDDGLTLQRYYPDVDQDSFGASNASGVDACTAPEGHVEDHSDCNDSRSDVFPGAEELNDSLDNDYDGQVDEGLEAESPTPDGEDDGSTGCSCSSGEKPPSGRGDILWALVGVSVGVVTRRGRPRVSPNTKILTLARRGVRFLEAPLTPACPLLRHPL